MHRAGRLAAFGRRYVQSGARREGREDRRSLATGGEQGAGSKGKLVVAGLAVVGVGGGIAYSTGVVDLPWTNKRDAIQSLKPATSFPPLSAKIPVVSATLSSADDQPIEESRLKRKKKSKKAEEAVSSAAVASETEPASISTRESASEDFTAIPPPAVDATAVVSATAEAAAALPLEDEGLSTAVAAAAAEASEAAEAAAVETAEEKAAEAVEAVAAAEVVAEAAAAVPEDVVAPVEEPVAEAPVAASDAEYLLEADTLGKIRDLDLEAEAQNKVLGSILNEALEESTKVVSSAAVSLVDAANAVQKYTILLKKALDDSNPERKSAWEEAVGLSLEKDRLLSAATAGYGEAKSALLIALQAIEGGRQNPKTRDNTELIRVEEQVYRLRAQLDDRFLALEKSQSDSRIMKAFTDLVEQGKQQFNAELKALMPDIKLNESGSKLSEAELNLLIAYAHRWIMQLQRQLAEYQLLEEQHLTDALGKQKAEDDVIAASQLREALAEQQGALTLEKERQVAEVRKKAEEDLLAQLKRQAAAHSHHLKEVLTVQEEDYNHRLKTILGEGIAVERRRLENMVREAFNQLKGIESAIDARAGVESAARARQDLWAAVAALKAAVGFEHRVPLGERVASVSAAAAGDELVGTLLGAISEDAKSGGIYSNAELKTRFDKVQEICKRVSLITDEGGLFQTFLSWLNYKTTVESVLIKPADEINPEIDAMKLVCHAQWYVEHDDLESALRCMNQLRGEPRRTAFDWISEARTALETRQAIDALHSWVSALNLGQFPAEMKS